MLKHIIRRNRQFLEIRDMHITSSCFGILIVCLAIHCECFGQELFKKEQLQKIDSTVRALKPRATSGLLNLLPNINYDVDQNTFNVGLSLNALTGYVQTKKRNKIELERLRLSMLESLDNEMENLQLEIDDFKASFETLKSKVNLFKIDSDLFKISKGRYKKKRITSEEFLTSKKDYLIAKTMLNDEILRLELRAKKIELKTKSDDLTSSLNILSTILSDYE